MNTTNQIFSWHRYTAALRKELVERRYLLLLLVGLMFLFFLALFYFPYSYSLETARMRKFFFIVYGFAGFSVIVPSLAFSQLTSKTGRVGMFSLPTSMFEKYAVGVTIYIIGFIVAFAVCVQLADWVRYYILLKQEGTTNTLVESVKMAATTRSLTWGYPRSEWSYSSWTIYAAYAPVFLMGSVLWPRWSVLKTAVAMTALGLVESFVIYFTVGFLGGGKLDWGSVQYNQQYLAMDDVINIILLVGSFVLGWYMFKRKDIISLKWWKQNN